MNTPILLITFNRPVHTRLVLKAIIEAKPKHLYVFQDGPREGNEVDRVKCEEVRQIIMEMTKNEPVQLHTFFSDSNLGCGPGPSTGITWFFDNVEQGMVFEDDCLPSPSIFQFYEVLLERYKDDNRISLITGTNALSKWQSYRKDYLFAKTGGMTMGCWASWRRAWQLFDFNIRTWGEQKYKLQFRTNAGPHLYTTLKPILDQFYFSPPRDAWDYQWAYARILNGTFSIVSTVNQMSNIGFGEESTHTPNVNDRRGYMQLFTCRSPLSVHLFKRDRLFEWVMYQRFSRITKKPIYLRAFLKLIDLACRR